jgi:hypothetical protein
MLFNPAPLESTRITTIEAACRFFGYLHANPRWSLKITPDEVELIYFIVLNHSGPGQTGTDDSVVSFSTHLNLVSTHFAFPRSWLTIKGRAQRAAQIFLQDAKQMFFMTDAFHDWKKQLFTTSILNLPNELLQRIAALLPMKFLVRLCRLNRRLSNVIGSELWRPLDRALKALAWSLKHCHVTVLKRQSKDSRMFLKVCPMILRGNCFLRRTPTISTCWSVWLQRAVLLGNCIANSLQTRYVTIWNGETPDFYPLKGSLN